MSICCSFHSIQDQHIDQIQAMPELVWAWLSPDDFEFNLNSAPSFWDKLLGRSKKPPSTLARPEMETGENEICDLDKAWHGLHDCLMSLNPKLNFILEGGHELSPVDIGYGPPRLFRSQETVRILQEIDKIQDFSQSYDRERLKAHDIYPQIWENEENAGQEYLQAAFEQAQQFLKHCQSHTLGFLIGMS